MAVVVLGDTTRGRGGRPRRKAPDERSLRERAGRVVTEIQTIRSLARLIDEMRLAPDVLGALEESCVVHVAKLRRFYFGIPDDCGTILATDYFPGPGVWEAIRPRPPLLFSSTWDELSGALAEMGESVGDHLRNRPDFRCQDLATEVVEVFVAFLRALSEERAAWFQRLLH